MDNVLVPLHKTALTDFAIGNLQQLSERLKSVSLSLAKAQPDQNMALFGMRHYVKADKSKNGHDCISSACAVGHFAILLGLECGQEGVIDDEGLEIGWDTFSEEYIGIPQYGEQSVIWDWLFSCRWSVLDDTPLGAAARIDRFLERGVPSKFSTSPAFDFSLDFDDVSKEESTHMISYYLARREALEEQERANMELIGG